MYRPLGHHATLSFLEQLAGRYQKDEKALLRALDVLIASREQWKQAVDDYAKLRTAAKARGERTPSPRDPNPCHFPPEWYGAARYGALHALAFRQFRDLLPHAYDDTASDVCALVSRTLTSGGELTADERELLADLAVEVRRRVNTAKGEAYAKALCLRQITRFIATAAG
jgi:hypothetical protein